MIRVTDDSAYAHVYVDGKLWGKRPLAHVPRVGDTVRLKADHFAKVTEIVWVFDELDEMNQRCNVRLETEK